MVSSDVSKTRLTTAGRHGVGLFLVATCACVLLQPTATDAAQRPDTTTPPILTERTRSFPGRLPSASGIKQPHHIRLAQQNFSAEATALPRDTARPKGILDSAEPLEFDYDNVELINVIKSLGARTGLNFEIDPSIGQSKVTIITHDKIPAEMAYYVLESVLTSRNFSMVPALDGNLIKIVPVRQNQEKYPLYIGKQEIPKGYDNFSTHIVAVRYAEAEELSSLLQSLGSTHASVNVYAKTNTLILTDTTDGIRNMLAFLKEVDVPGFDTTMEIFVLNYTRAETLAVQIQDVLMGADSGQAAPTRQPVVRRPTPTPRRPIAAAEQPIVVGSREETLRIVSDERLNALIVVASEALMERVRDLIEKLDCPTPYEANMLHVYNVLNADAEKMAEALNALVGTTPRQAGEQAAGPSAEVQPFEKQVVISTYEQTNALLIVAAPQDFTLLMEIITQLDVPQRQVHVEAIIMDVVINDTFELNVETTALSGNDAFALNNVVKLAEVLAAGPLAGAGPGGTVGVIDGTTELALPDPAWGITTTEIPNVPLLITSLENITDVDVLSQPSLVTVDNEEAAITVGQEVPFITGSSRALDQSAIGASVFSRVDRQEVGIKLTTTPQISEGDFVNLQVEVEVSQTVESNVGADPNIVGPTVQLSRVTNNVVIKDKATGIIAGLISEDTDHSRTQFPILGDIPAVGWLFRQKADRRSKRNLVVLLTPNIVRGADELEQMTTGKLHDFRAANVDVLFEKGFIRKIKKKRAVRNQYRPSGMRVEQMIDSLGEVGEEHGEVIGEPETSNPSG